MSNIIELVYDFDNIDLMTLENYMRDHFPNYLGYSLCENILKIYFSDIDNNILNFVNNFISNLKSENPIKYISDEVISDKILRKISFGKKLILQCSCNNYRQNLNTNDVKKFIEKTKNIIFLLSTGSLYSAREEIMALEIDDIITDELKSYFISEIDEFLFKEDGYVS